MQGFQTQRFNVTFRRRHDLLVSEVPTYWDEYGELFIYWQVHGNRWTVCPRSDDNRKDLLSHVRNGDQFGLAYEEADAGIWSEFTDSGVFVVTKGVRLRALSEHTISGPSEASPSEEGMARGTRISRWRKEARERKKISQMPKSLEEMKRLLDSDPNVEEVFMIKGPKEASLVVSFRSQRSAADAVELGRGLLACDPNVVDALSYEDLQRLREHSRGSYRPAPKDAKEGMDVVATGEEAVAPVEAPVEALDSVPGFQDIDLQEALLQQEVKQDQEQVNEQEHLQAGITELLQPLSGAKQQGDQRTQHDKEQPLVENRESSPLRPPVYDESTQKVLQQLQGFLASQGAEEPRPVASVAPEQKEMATGVAKSKGARAKAKSKAEAMEVASDKLGNEMAVSLDAVPRKEKKSKDKKEKKEKKAAMEERVRRQVEEENRRDEEAGCGPRQRPKWKLGILLRQAKFLMSKVASGILG